MRLIRNSFVVAAFTAALLILAAQAAPPRESSPAPSPIGDRVNVEFRSTPPGAEARYTLTEGGWWRRIKSKLPAGFGGNTAATVRTNKTQSLPFASGLKITSVFSAQGYEDCKVTAVMREDGDGTRRLEIAGNSQPLVSNPPAVIGCDLKVR